jgi:hypothetical protein
MLKTGNIIRNDVFVRVVYFEESKSTKYKLRLGAALLKWPKYF